MLAIEVFRSFVIELKIATPNTDEAETVRLLKRPVQYTAVTRKTTDYIAAKDVSIASTAKSVVET